MPNVKQAATALGVSPRTILRWLQSGYMRGEKNGDGATSSYVVDPDEIERLRQAHVS